MTFWAVVVVPDCGWKALQISERGVEFEADLRNRLIYATEANVPQAEAYMMELNDGNDDE